jgi:hypothetical protein
MRFHPQGRLDRAPPVTPCGAQPARRAPARQERSTRKSAASSSEDVGPALGRGHPQRGQHPELGISAAALRSATRRALAGERLDQLGREVEERQVSPWPCSWLQA